jgi:hypothetical protein
MKDIERIVEEEKRGNIVKWIKYRIEMVQFMSVSLIVVHCRKPGVSSRTALKYVLETRT